MSLGLDKNQRHENNLFKNQFHEITYLLHNPRLRVNVHCFLPFFAGILYHFYLVDDICDTITTFSYQYFIIYSVRYECLICARIPDISPDIRPDIDIRDEKPHPIRSRYLIFRTLTVMQLHPPHIHNM